MKTRIVVHFKELSNFPVKDNTEFLPPSKMFKDLSTYRLVTLLNVNEHTVVVCHISLSSSESIAKEMLDTEGILFNSLVDTTYDSN